MDLVEVVKSKLSDKRFRHCMGVAEMAKNMAEKLGVDSDKAYTAGIVHDIAKEMNPTEMLKICDKYGIRVDMVERKNPFLLHGPVAACIITQYGINDTDIINAVRYHTVGRAGMSDLERIIYLADMLEPSRKFNGVDELRELCEKDFDGAFCKCLQYSVEYNMKKNNLIHVATIEAWNDMLTRRENA